MKYIVSIVETCLICQITRINCVILGNICFGKLNFFGMWWFCPCALRNILDRDWFLGIVGILKLLYLVFKCVKWLMNVSCDIQINVMYVFMKMIVGNHDFFKRIQSEDILVSLTCYYAAGMLIAQLVINIKCFAPVECSWAMRINETPVGYMVLCVLKQHFCKLIIR